MTTTSSTGAALTWPVTSLGGLFSAYLVQRLHPAPVGGWLTIAELRNESISTWTDTEARRNVVEQYRILTRDTFGDLSQPTATASVTVPGSLFAITSNEDSSVNQDLRIKFPIKVETPDTLQKVAAAGRYGFRAWRSPVSRGEGLDVQSFLRRDTLGGTARGPDMWRPLLAKLRSDLSYLCVLSPTGHRWFVNAETRELDWACNAEVDVPINFFEVGDTPSTIVIT